jgi:transcriptional regulator with XRE-family HTH domain
MDILDKIRRLRIEHNWSEYQLAEKSGLTQSTISSWYRKDMQPSIASLEHICSAFNITLSQFFAADHSGLIDLTEDQLRMVNEWNRLSSSQQKALIAFMETL